MNSTGFYGVSKWHKALSASLTAFALILSSVAPLLAFPQQAFALDTGLKSPTTAVSPNDWNDPLNAVSSNDLYAVGQDDTSGSPQDDQGYGSFVFGVPLGATINGIEVRVEAKGEKANECKLNADITSKSGVDSQSQTITSTTTDNVYVFGGSADLWSPNSPWASTDFADGTFKLEFEVDDISGDSCNDSGSEDVLIDHVQVMVYYTEAALPPDYSISGSVSSIVGTLVNLAGLSGANPQTGADGTQHMAIDWDEDQDGDPETGTGWEVEALGGLVFTPTFTGSNPNRNFTDSWTASNDYSGFGGGTYNISVMVYHGNTPGQDGSAAATLNLEVVIPPQCSDGVDNDSDGLIDFPNDPGCTSAADDSESPNPVLPANLTLEKTVITDNGGTATSTDWTLSATGATTTISGVEGDTSITNADVVAGVYTLSETGGPSGYTNTGWVCTDGVLNGNSLTLAEGDDAVCTVTNNDQQGTLIVEKIIVDDNGSAADFEDFAFQVNGGATTTFSVIGQNSISVNAGTYSVVEVEGTEPLSGYTTSYNNCSNVSVANGETETCTITNDDKPASITVTKVVNNIRKTNAVESFGLSVGLEPVVSGVFELFSAGVYAITETNAEGYNAVFSGACTSGSVTAALGGVYECTITNNEKTPGTLTVIKIVQNDNAEEFRGTADADDFTISVTGGNPDPASFPGSATGVSVTIDGGATYNVSETGGPLTGYSVSYSADCLNQTMPEGGTKTCTVTNNDNDPTQAYITVLKEIVNDNGGEVQLNPWTLHVTDGESNVTNVTHGAANLFSPGTYTISESGDVGGYEQTGIACSTNGGSAVDGSQLTVAAGNSYVCTITNDDIAPSLTLVKEVTNDHGGEAVASDWTVGALGATSISGEGTVTSGAGFIEGTYTLTESAGPDGYVAGEWSCTNGLIVDENNQIEISVGQTSTCTLVNDDEPATLVVIKNVINDNGGDYDAEDFTMLVSGTDVSNDEFAGSEEGVSVTLDAGSYSVSESGPSGYGMDASDECEGTIANGETKVCTLTNDDGKATLTIEKYTEGADGSFTILVTGQEDVTLETVQGWASESLALDAGTYDVTELVPTGWTLYSSYCEYDNEEEVGESIENGESVTLGVGAEVTCEFYNYASGADLSLEKSIDDATPDAGQTIQFTLTVSNAGPAYASNITVYDVLPTGLTYLSDDGEGSYATSTGAWTVGSLADGESKTLTITVAVNNDVAGSTIVNEASVTLSDEGVSDYEEENNDDAVTVTVNNPTYQCSDGKDNDGDGNTDHGFDPSCTSPTDNDESDDPNGGGGGGGSLGGGITGLGGGNGQVLGASTVGQVLGESCGLFMDQYLRRGNAKNRADQVTKLQEFLVKHGYGTFTPTGFFGPLTEGGVKAFQAAYAQNVLAPWGLSQPTGLAYLTTLRQLNVLECPDLSLTIPELVEWSKNPAVQ